MVDDTRLFYEYEHVRTAQGFKAQCMYIPFDGGRMLVDAVSDNRDGLTCRQEFSFYCNPDGTDEHGTQLVYHEDEWKDMIGPYAELFDTYKPGDMVLISCRNPYDMTNIWRLAQLSHITVKKAGEGKYDVLFVLTHGSARRDPTLVKPYKGNEYLLGTRVA